ncbi:GGDEF domain-containing protein [Butyrivibrio sp. MC2021]|uniref:GGDEF domain-containing protein n=1 Tax=Butyrivibrio sp. MC2021 TaxID=1408306 RepID=UPI00047E23FD|nr:GGDEF domain-containing protein [Butyrivibrio sp. MC2021]
MMAQRNFVLSIISEMIFFISDTLCALIYNGVIPGNGVAIMIFKTIYFLSTATMCFFWFLYFEYLRETSLVKKKRKISLASSVIWLMALLLFGNFFGKYLFYIDNRGIYYRGPLFILTYVLAYSYVIISCARIITDIVRNDSKIDRNYLIILAMFPIAPGISGIMQFIDPTYPVACVAMSLTTLLLYLHWTDQLISVDPLTGLSNRKQLMLSFEQWKKNKGDEDMLFLLLVDANRFKYINDTYGHLEGDYALRLVAKALKQGCRNLPRRAIISRYGGDEFVVLVSTADVTLREELKNKINESLAEIVKNEDLRFELTVSIGCAALEDSDELKDLIARADEAMYEDKNTGR